jgi:hypothetical protein
MMDKHTVKPSSIIPPRAVVETRTGSCIMVYGASFTHLADAE